MGNLRPSVLDELGLLAAVSWLTRQYQKVYSHIEVRKNIAVNEEEIPEMLKTNIFRIIQEGLNNFAKHGKGNRITLCLKKGQGSIQLKIEDNGAGFDVNSCKQGMGLKNMENRVLFSRGEYSIFSQPGEGTLIQASWSIDMLNQSAGN